MKISQQEEFIKKSMENMQFQFGDYDTKLACLDKLKKRWDDIKNGHPEIKKVESLMRQIYTYVSKKKYDNLITGIQMQQRYGDLLVLLHEDKPSYNTISLATSASEKIDVFIKYSKQFTDKEYWKEKER